MAVNKGVYLTNSAVNSGTAVHLKGAKVTYTWKNLTEATPVPGKYDIVEANQGGWENPKIMIEGYIEVDTSSSNEITEVLLKQFAKAYATATTLSIGLGATPTAITAADASTETITVVIDTYTLNPSGEAGVNLIYNITLTETA